MRILIKKQHLKHMVEEVWMILASSDTIWDKIHFQESWLHHFSITRFLIHPFQHQISSIESTRLHELLETNNKDFEFINQEAYNIRCG